MGQESSSVIEELPRFDVEALDPTKPNPDLPQRRVRLVLISDTHGFHRHLKIPDGDVLVHTGDFSDFIVSGVHGRDFNEWLGSLPHPHKVVISGNHDYFLEPGNLQHNKTVLSNATHYLEDSGATIEGIKFWGTPWHIHRNSITRWANNFGITDIEILEKWKLIPDNIDILMTHFPPLGIGSDDEIGSSSLRNFVMNKIKPKLHAFGHNHNYYGVSYYAEENIHFVNSAQQEIGTKMRTPVVVDFYVLDETVHILSSI